MHFVLPCSVTKLTSSNTENFGVYFYIFFTIPDVMSLSERRMAIHMTFWHIMHIMHVTQISYVRSCRRNYEINYAHSSFTCPINTLHLCGEAVLSASAPDRNEWSASCSGRFIPDTQWRVDWMWIVKMTSNASSGSQETYSPMYQ